MFKKSKKLIYVDNIHKKGYNKNNYELIKGDYDYEKANYGIFHGFAETEFRVVQIVNVSSGAGANAGGENIPLNNSNPYSANTKDIMAKKSDDVSDDDYSFESSSTASVFVMIAVAMVIFVNICKKKN